MSLSKKKVAIKKHEAELDLLYRLDKLEWQIQIAIEQLKQSALPDIERDAGLMELEKSMRYLQYIRRTGNRTDFVNLTLSAFVPSWLSNWFN
jgi:hypothetical protein